MKDTLPFLIVGLIAFLVFSGKRIPDLTPEKIVTFYMQKGNQTKAVKKSEVSYWQSQGWIVVNL